MITWHSLLNGTTKEYQKIEVDNGTGLDKLPNLSQINPVIMQPKSSEQCSQFFNRPEAYLESMNMCDVVSCVKAVSSLSRQLFLQKSSILDVRWGFKYASASLDDLNAGWYSGSYVQLKKFNLVPKKFHLVPNTFNLVPKKFNLVQKKINLVPKKINLVPKKISFSAEKL